MKIIQTLSIIFILIFQLNAQVENSFRDKVILKNGSILYGQLIDYSIGDQVKLKLSNGQILTFGDKNVKKIVINSPDSDMEEEREYKSNTVYNFVSFNYIPGNNEDFDLVNSGLGLDYSAGYRFNNYISLGAGIGVETYNYGLREFFIPIHVDFLSILKKNKVSPFFRFQGGYGFVKATSDKVIDSNGGLMLNPAFGIIFLQKNNTGFTIDMNFKFQRANFVINSSNWNSQISYRDIDLMRLCLRFGVLF